MYAQYFATYESGIYTRFGFFLGRGFVGTKGQPVSDKLRYLWDYRVKQRTAILLALLAMFTAVGSARDHAVDLDDVVMADMNVYSANGGHIRLLTIACNHRPYSPDLPGTPLARMRGEDATLTWSGSNFYNAKLWWSTDQDHPCEVSSVQVFDNPY
jgi:hypothetical protein